jgi:hypothetical protein
MGDLKTYFLFRYLIIAENFKRSRAKVERLSVMTVFFLLN